MEREKQEQKEVISERIDNLGGASLEAIRMAQYSDSPEDQMLLDFICSRSPNWTKSADDIYMVETNSWRLESKIGLKYGLFFV